MTIKFTPLLAPQLSDWDERKIVRIALERLKAASGNQINITDAHSPATAFIEAQALASAELLWQADKLAERFSVLFLQNYGIQQKLGTTALGEVRFELKSALASPYTIPAGVIVLSGANKRYRTVENLTFAPAELARTVGVESVEVGTAYNVPANAIGSMQQPLAFVSRVFNPEPITGGTDAETIEQTKIRAFERLRSRGLVQAVDWESEARSVLGGGIAVAIPNLSPDGQREEQGTVHLFVANSDGSLPSDEQRESLRAYLDAMAPLTIETIVSSCDPQPVYVEVIVSGNSGSNPTTIANTIASRLMAYLTPGRFPFGQTVILNELEWQSRVNGVSFVQGVTLGTQPGLTEAKNFAMRYRWSIPILTRIGVRVEIDSRPFAYTFEF
jgi:hypothetical protein